MEEVIQYLKKELNAYEYTKDLDLKTDNYFGQFEEKINMISKILNELERLQKENERLQVKYDKMNKFLHSNSCVIQNENGDLVSILLTPENFISKQVIRDKIDELKGYEFTSNDYDYIYNKGRYETLKELLGDE